MIKRKKLRIVLVAATVLMSVVSVSAAEFTSGDEDAVMENTKAQDMTDEGNLFDDGTAFIEGEDVDFAFEDAVSEQTVSAEDVPIDEEHFPCKAFREVLSQESYDRNTNGILEEMEIKEITSFSEKKYDPDGFYMEGYQYLTSLEHLDLYFKYYTKVSEPDTALELDFSTLPNLRSLYVDVQPSERVRLSGKILSANLNLSENKKLTDLNLSCGVAVRKLPKDCNIKNYTMSCWDLDYEYPHWHSESD